MEKEPDIQNKKIKEYGKDKIEEGDLVRNRGKLYRAVKRDTGYTIREYFSHETLEKGPGPGWDRGIKTLFKEYGVWEPKDLPDEPYYELELEPIEDEN